MLSPLREPAYAATARTVSGSLCELERIIGDSLFTGYVGYNGRAPGGVALKKDDIENNNDRNKTGGDARHTLVAYFEIVELAALLAVDRETVNLAVRIFRHTASNTSLRNRNVESLATAAFVAASERRYEEYQQSLKSENHTMSITTCKNDASSSNAVITDTTNHIANESNQRNHTWAIKPRRLSVEEVAAAANLEVSEVQRYLKVVNTALRKQKQEGSSSIVTHMPAFCTQLDLPQRTRALAMDIVDRIVKFNVCHRRNPVSVAAAAIYLACQLDSVRKTQTEICRVTSLTEVTLRKVHKELNAERKRLIPDWFKRSQTKAPNSNMANSGQPRSGNARERRKGDLGRGRDKEEFSGDSNEMNTQDVPSSLVPPPLPPGFDKGGRALPLPPPSSATVNTVKSTSDHSALPQLPPKLQKAGETTKDKDQNTAALLAMFNSSAIQAFTNVMSQMPQMMMPPPPPPPPPLPALDQTGNKSMSKGRSESEEKKGSVKSVGQVQDTPNQAPTSTAPNTRAQTPAKLSQLPALPAATPTGPSGSSSVVAPSVATLSPAAAPLPTLPTPVPGPMPDATAMAGFQSMMGMMQMMLQTAQRMGVNESQGSTAGNPFAMMSAVMSQMQNANTNASPNRTSQVNGDKAEDSDAKETLPNH